jgi:hypothetical protein
MGATSASMAKVASERIWPGRPSAQDDGDDDGAMPASHQDPSGPAGGDHVFQPGDVPVVLEVALRGAQRELPVAHHVPHHVV